MATHKIPQDVEAEDKLLGPLSLKQFIFVILGIGFGYLTFVFATKIHFLLAIIWIPPMAFFLILGLYQRKDQPAEVFLASALRFYFKPRTRKWDQDGYQERVIITAPPKIERQYTKNFTGAEASSRLSGLSRMMDTRGWASRLQSQSEWQNPALATAAASSRIAQPVDIDHLGGGVNPQLYMQPVDMMDEATSVVAHDLQTKISVTQSDTRRQAMAVVEQARQESQQAADNTPEPVAAVRHDPFPKAMHQRVVQPLADQPRTPQPPLAPTPQASDQPKSDTPAPPTVSTPQQTAPIHPATRAPQATTAAQQDSPAMTSSVVEAIEEDGSVSVQLH